ncbi:Uncharacterised protein [Chlamydia trachomatis]|nr:Uncharacterised protein [Chlamydia trachomatis]
MVQNRQKKRLEHRALGEGPLDGQQRGAWEIAFAFGIAANRTGEVEILQIIECVIGDDLLGVKPIDLSGLEFEAFERFENATSTCDNTEASGCGKTTPENLESGCAPCGTGFQSSIKHGQFIHVRQQ